MFARDHAWVGASRICFCFPAPANAHATRLAQSLHSRQLVDRCDGSHSQQLARSLIGLVAPSVLCGFTIRECFPSARDGEGSGTVPRTSTAVGAHVFLPKIHKMNPSSAVGQRTAVTLTQAAHLRPVVGCGLPAVNLSVVAEVLSVVSCCMAMCFQREKCEATHGL